MAAGQTVLLSANTVNSVVAGIGIQLGDNPAAACVIDVNDVDLVGNVLTGGAVPSVVALCDVGTFTITP